MKAIVAVIAGTASIVIALVVTGPHWWKKLSDASVTHNGRVSLETDVYRSRDGKLLVDMKRQGAGMFIIFLENHEIGTTSPSNFFILPGYAYSRNTTPPFALMSPVKSTAPRLVIQQGVVEFNSDDDVRIRITW
jgi:hypothetical protein